MENITPLRELQLVELAMVKKFIAVCEKHHLKYILIGGTALGAIRHNGFIPWDDDIDIGMPRPDYDKFLQLQSEFDSDDLFLQNYKTDHPYPWFYTKIRNNKTTFIENNTSGLKINNGVFIDIFPFDGCKNHTSMRLWSFLIYLPTIHRIKKHYNRRNFYYIWFINSIALLGKIFIIRNWYLRLLEHVLRKRDYDSSTYCALYPGTGLHREINLRSDFDNGPLHQFEDIMLTIPFNADLYLKKQFNDYMTPPKKTTSRHHTIVTDLTKSYKEYTNQK